MSQDPRRIADLVEIHELCARYMAYASQFVPDQWLTVFTPDVGVQRLRHEVFSSRRDDGPAGLRPREFLGIMPEVELDGHCAIRRAALHAASPARDPHRVPRVA